MRLRFLADRMLGKLAKKLRLLGFDTLYFPEEKEEKLLSIAMEQDRILLTKDTDFYKKAMKTGVKIFLLKSDRWRSQLKAVFDKFKIKSSDLTLFSRCMECNEPLETVDKEEIRDRIPEYIYLTHDEFKICKKCGRVYWKGTHVDHMVAELSRILNGEVLFKYEDRDG